MSLDGAAARAARLYKSPAFRKVYVAGAAAANVGRSIDVCPYPTERQRTWRTAYRRAWLRGYTSIAPATDEQVG